MLVKTLARSIAAAALLLVFVPNPASANHAWANYHWARQSNPFTVVLLDGVSSSWDASLTQASADWSKSTVLDTVVVASSTNPKSCKGTAGKVQVCSAAYGNRGWLGVAQIYITGDHITQGTVKLNDSYFAPGSSYDTPAWRNLVTCQEVGHTFGLDHQDEIFDNPNLGTCMDYTNDPTTNQHPNKHDYDELAIIYKHLDSTTTVAPAVAVGGTGSHGNRGWGQAMRTAGQGRPSTFVRELRSGQRVFTFVIWAR
ncbi:MAG: hypothetical protein ABI869_00230 [Actinomycetota bacterium]